MGTTLSTAAAVRLVDATGVERAVTPTDVANRHSADGFFWIDLESPSDQDLAVLSEALGLPTQMKVRADQDALRSRFVFRGDSVAAVLPAAVDSEDSAWLDASYVTVVLTERFLFTTHTQPCAPLQHARTQYLALNDPSLREEQVRLLFLVLDDLIDSFRPQLLALDDRLGEIQLGMLDGARPEVHDELVQILGILTDGIQELGWYAHDLEEIEGVVGRLPGERASADEHFARHRRHVTRMRENGREIREESKDALRQYSEVVAGRQAQVLGSLTVVATVFLPLSFVTGYFGMNFATLTGHVQIGLGEYLLLGLLLPIGSAALSLLLIHRLQRRFGLLGTGRRPDRGDGREAGAGQAR